MQRLHLQLLVLRCKDVEASRRFYERLGLTFTKEKHGSGPEHYASTEAGFVLELYPVKEGHGPDNVRLGFSLPGLGELIDDLMKHPDVIVLKQPRNTADGLVVVLQDPDGRAVKVTEPMHR